MSVWVTFMALSRLREDLRSFLFLFSGLLIAMFVTWDKYSLLTFAVPALIGLVIMIISWVGTLLNIFKFKFQGTSKMFLN